MTALGFHIRSEGMEGIGSIAQIMNCQMNIWVTVLNLIEKNMIKFFSNAWTTITSLSKHGEKEMSKIYYKQLPNGRIKAHLNRYSNLGHYEFRIIKYHGYYTVQQREKDIGLWPFVKYSDWWWMERFKEINNYSFSPSHVYRLQKMMFTSDERARIALKQYLDKTVEFEAPKPTLKYQEVACA